MLLTAFADSVEAVRGNEENPLYFSCGHLLEPDYFVEYYDEDRGRNVKIYPSINESSSHNENCNDPSGYCMNIYKYPYFASPVQSKPCNLLRCELEIKIYT